MKTLPVLLVICILGIPVSHAQGWVPWKLEISSPDMIWMSAGNNGIPVTVSGSDAVVYFAVFTKDQAEEIANVETNSLSWRAVNKIDTCIYVSPPHFLTEGGNIIEWEPHASDGIQPGRYYYYYLWAVDSESPKELVSRDIPFPPTGGIIQTHDYEGNPFTQPFYYPSANVFTTGVDSVTITRQRWCIGTDPLDASAIEETWYRGAPAWAERGPLALSPYTPFDFYATGYDIEENFGTMRRFTWVTGGEAEWDTSWGDEGEVRFESGYPPELLRDPGAVYVGEDEMLSAAYFGNDESLHSTLPAIDGIDGFLVYTIVSQPWWQPPPYSVESAPLTESMKFDVINGLPSLIMGNHLDALIHLLNPQDPDEYWLRYAAELPVPPEESAGGIPSIGREGFALFPGMGENGDSMGLLAPDGTWAGLLPLTGEESPRYNVMPVSYGSAYDGLYFDTGDDTGLWYRGYDSKRGIIEVEAVYRPLQIVAPNGGETIPAGSVYTIQADNYSYRNVMLYLKYTLDNGLSWSVIDSMYTRDATISYDWNVPNVESDLCKIRIIRPARENYDYDRDESNAVFSISGGAGVEESHPPVFAVFPASPNPFNPSTTIEFTLPAESPVTVSIFNTLGQRVTRLQDGVLDAGSHRVVWDAAGFGPGLYFYRVETNAGMKTGKMMLVK